MRSTSIGSFFDKIIFDLASASSSHVFLVLLYVAIG